MRDFRRGRYLVQFTEHRTVEKELVACDASEAVALAAAVFHAFGHRAFTPVECDITDWTVCSLEPSPIDAANVVESLAPHLPPPLSASATLTPADLHFLAQLLYELRDTTLSRFTFEQVDRMLELIRPQCEACNAQEG